MLSLNTSKKMYLLRRKLKTESDDCGFTMIELIVVLMMVGILTAFGLPIMVRQVGKAKETEAVNNLSAVGFAQQAYYFEFREFASNYEDLGISLSPKFFTYPQPDTPVNGDITRSQAISVEANALGSSRNYAYGTYYVTGTYSVTLCQSPDSVTITQAPNTYNGACINGVRQY